MTRSSFFTTLQIDGKDVDVLVSYARDAGYAGDSIDPPEAPSFEIHSFTCRDGVTVVPQEFYYDEGLLACCERHYAGALVAACP